MLSVIVHVKLENIAAGYGCLLEGLTPESQVWAVTQVWDLTKVAAGEGGAVTKLESMAAVQAHAKDINSLSVSHNGSLICSASQDKLAKV